VEYSVKTPQQLGQVLQGLRKQKGITQKAAGSRVGLLQSAVSEFETAPGRSSVERLFTLLSALELDVFIRDRVTPVRTAKSRSKKVEW
jgi:transcriptional regulator with XRE-family HTH domain